MNDARPVGGPSLLDIRIDEKTYIGANGGSVAALHDFRLTVTKNAFDVIIGPSGCGKTTFLRIVAGLDDAFKGQIRGHKPERLGFVFQEPRLLPWRTTEENISLTAAPNFGPKELAELSADMGLSEVLNRYPSELSLGLARRVALARAFAAHPDVILLDEPFVSLDEPTAERLRRLLIHVWSSRPTTVVMVTHNLHEALQLADRIVLLSHRPAHVCGEWRVDIPREARTENDINALRRKIRSEFPDLL